MQDHPTPLIGAYLPQPIPFVVPLPPTPGRPRPDSPDGYAPDIEDPPLPGHFPFLGLRRGLRVGTGDLTVL